MKKDDIMPFDSSRFDEHEISFFDPETVIENMSGNLPHWRQQNVIYFVTFRTAYSLPQHKMEQWKKEKKLWLEFHPPPHSIEVKREFYERFPARMHKWLDAGHGECLLAKPVCKNIVENAMRYFDGERYNLDVFVIMPNHVHVLVKPVKDNKLSEILHSWKSFTGNKINELEGKTGSFRQKESFDHIVRDEYQLERFRQYIRDNPKMIKRKF